MRDALRALEEHHTRRGKGKPAGAWSVGGRRKEVIRGFTTKLAVLLVLGGLFCYLVLPGLIENQLAGRLQAAFGPTT